MKKIANALLLATAGLSGASLLGQAVESSTSAVDSSWVDNIYSNYQLRKYDRYYGNSETENYKLNNLQHRLYLGTKFLDGKLNVYYAERYEKADVNDQSIDRTRPYFVAEYALSGDNFDFVPYLWIQGNANDAATTISPAVYGKIKNEISTPTGTVQFFGSVESLGYVETADQVGIPTEADPEVSINYDRPLVMDMETEVVAGVSYKPNWLAGLTLDAETAIDRTWMVQFDEPEDANSETASVKTGYKSTSTPYNRLTVNYKVTDRFSFENETYQYLSSDVPFAVRTSDVAARMSQSYMNLLKVNYTIL